LYNTFGPSICNQGLGGLAWAGGPLAALRPSGFNGGTFLKPESGRDYVIGFGLAPTRWLSGFDAQASW